MAAMPWRARGLDQRRHAGRDRGMGEAAAGIDADDARCGERVTAGTAVPITLPTSRWPQ